MDLTVSPDLPAYCCYGIVFILGIFVAIVQVKKRLGDMNGIWFVTQTWLLFIAYVTVPVALFWLLDRTSAITDTSLFAAVLIGVGYERIITGSNQTLRAPGDVSSLWTPFLAYADKVARVVLDRGARNQQRLAEKLIAEVMKEPERYVALEAFALGRSSDSKSLRAELNEIDNMSESGEGDKLEKKARLLYGQLLSVPDIHFLLKGKKIISPNFYWLQVKQLAQLVPLTLVAIILVGYLGKFVILNYSDYREITSTYHVWRLGKTNTTSVDQYRNRHHIIELMEHDDALNEKITDQLIYLVERPELPMERVDLVIQTLLESRTTHPNRNLAIKLVHALRGGSLDSRTRINDTLTFLALPCSHSLDSELSEWKPAERYSSTMLEEKINAWNHFWADVCLSK